MKIGIYDPYLDTLGGGEKYVISIAKFFEENNQVDIFWDNDLREEIKNKFSINLIKTNFKKNIFSNGSLINKFLITKKYDLIFFISDGSIPFLFAKKNFLIFQFPPKNKIISFVDRIKLFKITKIICYSDFVKKYLGNDLKSKTLVLYPPVNAIDGNLSKENIILNVGRFTQQINNKKQDFMISAFKEFKYNKTWKFILAGSFLSQDKKFVNELEEMSKGSNLEIFKSPNSKELADLYKKAKIYWHATGVGEDIEMHPEKAEHFGISTVEAMSAGAVPVVINAGGQKEIVENGISGYLWDSESQLLNLTEEFISDEKKLKQFSDNAKKRAKSFSTSEFNKNLMSLIS